MSKIKINVNGSGIDGEVVVDTESAFAAHYIQSGMNVALQRCTAGVDEKERPAKAQATLENMIANVVPAGGGGASKSPELSALHKIIVADKVHESKGVAKTFPTIETARAALDESQIKRADSVAKALREVAKLMAS